MNFLSLLPWTKIFEFAIGLIVRALKHSDNLKELERDWLIFTKNINKKIPVKISDDQQRAIARLEEMERLEKAKNNALKTQVENYKINNEKLYSENLKLQNESVKNNFIKDGEF